jgi:hypothetical protein
MTLSPRKDTEFFACKPTHAMTILWHAAHHSPYAKGGIAAGCASVQDRETPAGLLPEKLTATV